MVGSNDFMCGLEHAVDVLNRTTGPTAENLEGPTSYEMLTGKLPRVMDILPFGCRMYALKPRSQYSKTTIDPRAYVGYNLGRSARSPGAYIISIPGRSNLVTTSEVYYQESCFPCRPKGQQHDDSIPEIALPAPVESEPQPPGVPLIDSRVTAATAAEETGGAKAASRPALEPG